MSHLTTTTKTYSLSTMDLILHDRAEGRRKNIRFHIKSDDYFGTMATALSLIRQITDKKNQELQKVNTQYNKILNNLEKDLMFLHTNYKIVKK